MLLHFIDLCKFFVAKCFSKRQCGNVHITVSSLKEAYLELNWITDCYHPLDVKPKYIALFDKEPKVNVSLHTEINLFLLLIFFLQKQTNFRILEKIYASNHPNGFYRTTIPFREFTLPENWEYSENLTKILPGKRCFPYWIASIDEDSNIIKTQCLAIQPTWMNDNRYTRKVYF